MRGSYCEEWGIKGRGDPEGRGSYCEEWGIKGRGTLRGWVLTVRSGVLRGLGSYCRKYGYHDYGSIGESLLTFFGSLTCICLLLSDKARAIIVLR